MYSTDSRRFHAPTPRIEMRDHISCTRVTHFRPGQFEEGGGVIPDGCEAAIHSAPRYLSPLPHGKQCPSQTRIIECFQQSS
jgi:hypothetical protein